MKHLIFLAASLLMLAAPSAFAEKTFITKDIQVSEYTSVDCNIPCDIEYTQGPASVKVCATQKTLDRLVVTVNAGKLKICMDKTKIFDTEGIEIQISSSKITSVNLNGSIDFEAEKGIDTDSFKAVLNGTSKLEIKGLSAQKAEITANGTASMEVENANCGSLEMKLNGAGDCDLKAVECGKLTVTVNGAGGSEIEGYAKEARLTVNGVGGINAKELKADVMNTAMNGIGKISR